MSGEPTRATTDRRFEHPTTVIVRTVVRLVVPLILVTAVALLLQGHNLPGGGFIGGVLTATAFVLLYVVFGLDYVKRDLLGRGATATDDADGDDDPTDVGLVPVYRWVFSHGLALALLAGLAPIAFGLPFLTQGVLFVEHVPLYGELEVASALAFDLGVYFTVVGGLLTIIAEVGAE